MLADRDKISVRQTVIIFFMMISSPAIRLFPRFTAEHAGKAGWLAPIIAAIPVLFLIFVINAFFKQNEEENLSDIFNKILGKTIGKTICILYFIWILILASLYLRYYAERILSSMMPYASIYLFVFIMLIIIFYSLRSGIVSLARLNEAILGIFWVIIVLTVIMAFPQIRYRNIMNISYKDIIPAGKASFFIFNIWGYIIFLFFFADKINDKEKVIKVSVNSLIFVLILSFFYIIITIGALGPILTTHLSFPFFSVIKNISILETIERVESVLLSIWVLTDFSIISALIYICVSLISSIFNISETKSTVTPLLLIAGMASLMLFADRFEIERFTKYIGFPLNFMFEFVIPFIVYGIGKIRKVC